MDRALLVSRLVLAGVFLVAGATKLANLSGSRRAMADFGVPRRLAPALGTLVPVAELAVAVTLLPGSTAWAAAVAGLCLLAAFTVAIAVQLIRGTQAPCNCFGTISARPVGPGTLARNVVLVGLAVFVVAAGRAGTSALGWIGDLSTGGAALVVSGALLFAVVFMGGFLWQLFRQNGRLWAEIEALRGELAHRGPAASASVVGELAPRFALADLDDRVVGLEDLLADGRGLWLVFSDPHCGACDLVLPEIARLQGDPLADPWPVLLSLGSIEDNRAKAAEYGVELVLLHPDAELPHSLGVAGTPGLIALDAAGRVLGKPVMGAERVAEALRAGSTSDKSEILEVGLAS